FLSLVGRYVPPDEGAGSGDPYSCGCGEPAPEDWADALTPGARELEAIKRALAEGWIREAQAERMRGDRILAIPGLDSLDATRVSDVMAAYYRQQAERYLLRPPPQRRLGEAVVPTTLEDWEPGDAERDIDWLATLVQRGDRLGVVQPLRRVRL